MPYSIDTFSGSKTFLVEEGTINNTLDIRLIGKNYAGYGEVQNENFVHILENFAGVNPPPRPTNGQIWYDDLNKKIKFWDATALQWKSTGGVTVSVEEPTNLSEGDLWWKKTTKQLFAYDGIQYVLIGPYGLEGFEKTVLESMIVTDSNDVSHAVLTAYVDGNPMFIVSTDTEFTLSDESRTFLGGPDKYGIIKKGITLVGTNNGSGVSEDSIFWGTVSDAINSENAVNALNTTNITGGEEGSIPYQASTGSTVFLSPNISTERKFLSQAGTGSAPFAPSWITLPTVLPIAKNDGTILNIPLANGFFSIQDRNGNLVNITVN